MKNVRYGLQKSAGVPTQVGFNYFISDNKSKINCLNGIFFNIYYMNPIESEKRFGQNFKV